MEWGEGHVDVLRGDLKMCDQFGRLLERDVGGAYMW